jgi:hypothetical protein
MQTNVLLVSEVVFYVAGVIPTAALWVLYFLSPSNSTKLNAVQRQLAQIDRYWSRDLNKLVSISDKKPEKGMKNYLLAATMLTFMSWAGLVFSLILIYSIKFMNSRIEQKLTRSPLATGENLKPDQITEILNQNLIDY